MLNSVGQLIQETNWSILNLQILIFSSKLWVKTEWDEAKLFITNITSEWIESNISWAGNIWSAHTADSPCVPQRVLSKDGNLLSKTSSGMQSGGEEEQDEEAHTPLPPPMEIMKNTSAQDDKVSWCGGGEGVWLLVSTPTNIWSAALGRKLLTERHLLCFSPIVFWIISPLIMEISFFPICFFCILFSYTCLLKSSILNHYIFFAF